MIVTKKRITKTFLISFVSILFFTVSILSVLSIKHTFAVFETSILQRLVLLEDQLNESMSKSALLHECNNYFLNSTSFALVDSHNQIFYESVAFDIDQTTVNKTRSNGSFSFIRYQATDREYAYYHATLLNDGSILYTKTLLSGSLHQIVNIAISFSAVLVLGILLALFLTPTLSKLILTPIYQATEQSDKIMKNKNHVPAAVAKELSPIMDNIIALKNEINHSVSILNAEQATRQALIENISEGLILLDEHQQIISINNSAKDVLFLNKYAKYEGRNIFELIQIENLKKSLTQAISSKSATTFEDQIQDRYYKYFISPSNYNGFLIFIVDTTKETKENIIRRDFASNVSHELKTPLTSIRGFAEMLECGMLTDTKDIEKTASIIYRQSNRLLFLIEDIMRLSQIENMDKEKNSSVVDLPTTIEEVIEALSIIAKEKNITLHYEHRPAKIYADSMMMHELFFNLIENAIKYNVENGSVMIQAECNLQECTIIISDSGIGIPHKHAERIFERFYRVDQSRSRDTGGTGLGLSIVKHIVEQHQGRIYLTSSEDSGTTIEIRLPASKMQP